MSNICPKCGLPLDLCVCKTIAKEEQRIQIRVVKRRFGKMITLVAGFDTSIDIKDIAKNLKSRLACGGTVKEKTIELQGDHKAKVKKELTALGFNPNTIDMI
ncbi:translation initiation factor [Candidatus Woesearchaeota archaeon]|nr:translation initiation factor [Candidatus Woesearchaeota archaeon]